MSNSRIKINGLTFVRIGRWHYELQGYKSILELEIELKEQGWFVFWKQLSDGVWYTGSSGPYASGRTAMMAVSLEDDNGKKASTMSEEAEAS